jgi:hypothetical protein
MTTNNAAKKYMLCIYETKIYKWAHCKDKGTVDIKWKGTVDIKWKGTVNIKWKGTVNIKWKTNKYHTVGNIPKSNIKIVERSNIDTDSFEKGFMLKLCWTDLSKTSIKRR